MINRLFKIFFGRMDGILLGLLVILLLLGTAIIWSGSGQSTAKLMNQGINISVALGVMWVFSHISPQQLARLAAPIYITGVILLLGVALVGDLRLGARRWLDLGFMSIQPSELMRIGVPLMLAYYLDRHAGGLGLRQFAVATILLLVPVGFILKQPDLGTSLLIASSGFYVMFLAGLSYRVIGGLLLAAAAAAPILWTLLHDYQRQRILTLLDPTADPLGAGYHIIQSTIAIGSGGLFGKGWLQGSQSQLDFLPESSTDFVFAVFAEEFGFVGICLLLLLYFAVIARGLYIAANAPTLFSRLLAGAIVLNFFTYIIVNIGMVSGLLPVVGVPLPLLSYGGTSLVTLLLGFGILMSIHAHRKLVQT